MRFKINSKILRILDSIWNYIIFTKAYASYCEGFGDSGDIFGQRLGAMMKDLGTKMKDSGRYCEAFGERLRPPDIYMEYIPNYEKSGKCYGG